ncbi:MAG: class I SAM-dependent methyltransferase [Defluviitaleaceae bacterium]|nr:class I SAM-dependent methyltransferase [Defluviitaleaceae bacterium]
MKKENHFQTVAKSYDRHFTEYGNEDALCYDKLPDHIMGSPDYPHWKAEHDGKADGAKRIDIKDWLAPQKDMNFVHLGCSLGLKFKGYDAWPSNYFGVDISRETILFLYDYVAEKRLPIGGLYCGSVHETPFAENFFHIGDCIGVLEYYERDYVYDALREFNRIIKPGGRLALDIPNIASPSGRAMMEIEKYMGREDKFDMLPHEFEKMLDKYFYIEDSDLMRTKKSGAEHTQMMIYYCLICKK